MEYQDFLELQKQEFFRNIFETAESNIAWKSFRLKKTRFYLDFSYRDSGMRWVDVYEDIPFDTDLSDILPQLPKEIAEEILFHLEWFR